MSRLENLPTDISALSLLPYISPKDLDAYCASTPRLESWCSDPDNIRYYLNLHRLSFASANEGLDWAVEHANSYFLAIYFISHGANEYYWAMRSAIVNGNIKTVKLLLKSGATDYNNFMLMAASVGNVDMVKLFLDYGANNYDDAMRAAAFQGNTDIVELMLDLGATAYNEAMAAAAQSGHIDIVRLMLNLGATNLNETMYYAAVRGHMNIVRLMINLGANDFDFDEFWHLGHPDISNYLQEITQSQPLCILI